MARRVRAFDKYAMRVLRETEGLMKIKVYVVRIWIAPNVVIHVPEPLSRGLSMLVSDLRYERVPYCTAHSPSHTCGVHIGGPTERIEDFPEPMSCVKVD